MILEECVKRKEWILFKIRRMLLNLFPLLNLFLLVSFHLSSLLANHEILKTHIHLCIPLANAQTILSLNHFRFLLLLLPYHPLSQPTGARAQ